MNAIKNTITICLLLCISIICFSACEKIANDTPKAIKELIKKWKKSSIFVSVTEYSSKGKMIYLFEGEEPPNVIDGSSTIYDKDGNWLCSIGGIAGERCEEYQDRTKIRVIWTKK